MLLDVRERDSAVVVRVAYTPVNHLLVAHHVDKIAHFFLGHPKVGRNLVQALTYAVKAHVHVPLSAQRGQDVV